MNSLKAAFDGAFWLEATVFKVVFVVVYCMFAVEVYCMIQKFKVIVFALIILVFVFLVLNIGSVFEKTMIGLNSIVEAFSKDAAAISSNTDSNVASNAQTKAFNDFAAKFTAADRYSFSCTKKITGDSIPFTTTFSCSVNGDDYAISAIYGSRKLRQLYVNGKYNLLDDTARVVYEDIAYISYPDLLLHEACSAKILRVKEDIIDGEPVECFELYADGIMYELYFSQQGEMLRYYSISDNYEMEINFTDFTIGSIERNSFLLLPEYSYYDSNRFDSNIYDVVMSGTGPVDQDAERIDTTQTQETPSPTK